MLRTRLCNRQDGISFALLQPWDTPSKIEERFWKHDYLFTKQNYTLLFDRESDMDMVGDTALKSVQVEWIYLKTRMVKKYYFGT